MTNIFFFFFLKIVKSLCTQIYWNCSNFGIFDSAPYSVLNILPHTKFFHCVVNLSIVKINWICFFLQKAEAEFPSCIDVNVCAHLETQRTVYTFGAGRTPLF